MEHWYQLRRADLWWFGFDCAHAGDSWSPEAAEGVGTGLFRGEHRTLSHVTYHCEHLARQLQEMSGKVRLRGLEAVVENTDDR